MPYRFLDEEERRARALQLQQQYGYGAAAPAGATGQGSFGAADVNGRFANDTNSMTRVGPSGVSGGSFGGSSFQSPYQERIDELMDALLAREFSYDQNSDPLWQSYQDTYTREGQRAMQDTLGQLASRTGGMAGSYAASAAAQANNYYMQQLSDKLPELYQAAYQRYLNEGDEMRSNLGMLTGLDETGYGRYADQRNFDYNAAQDSRNFAYQQYLDAMNQANTDRNFNYQASQDALAQQNYLEERAHDWDADQREWDYRMQSDEWNRAWQRAQAGDYSALESFGVDTSQLRAAAESGNVYAYSDDGGTYTISTPKGIYFLQNAAPGQKMTGSDGSTWVMSDDGKYVTITTADGKVYRIGDDGSAKAVRYYGPGTTQTDTDKDDGDVKTGINNFSQLSDNAKSTYYVLKNAPTASSASVAAQIEIAVAQGYITEEEAKYILNSLGYY